MLLMIDYCVLGRLITYMYVYTYRYIFRRDSSFLFIFSFGQQEREDDIITIYIYVQYTYIHTHIFIAIKRKRQRGTPMSRYLIPCVVCLYPYIYYFYRISYHSLMTFSIGYTRVLFI